jgi:hypothetical protein
VGVSIPEGVAKDLSLLKLWDSQLRYEPGAKKMGEAEEFLAAVERVREWADGRL